MPMLGRLHEFFKKGITKRRAQNKIALMFYLNRIIFFSQLLNHMFTWFS